jgi:polyhydroxybutyrate depolymerase
MRGGGTMRSSMARVLLAFCASWALHACSSEDDASRGAGTCTPAALLACDCPNGLRSVASCLPDGSGLGPCACNDPVVADAAPPVQQDSGAPPAALPDGSVADAGMLGLPTDATLPAPDGGGTPSAHAAVPSAGCGAANPPASGSKTIDVGGTQREYIVTVPTSYDANRPHRLIFAWHGLGGRAMQVASSHYGLASRAGGSAIFIAAQALPNPQQNNLPAWANRNDGDVTLTRRLVEWAETNYCIDTKRVFSVGMSNGGMMSNIVGCELGDTFRAIAAMSGGGPRGYAMQPCVGQVAVWITHGNKDNNVPFNYGQMSRDYWRGVNNCGTENKPTMSGDCVEYQGCDQGFPVQFCEFDGGHMVPSFAAEAVWKFFEQL